MNVTLHKKGNVKLLAGHHARLMIDDKKSSKDTPKLHSIEAIHHRAETVTPLLKGILDFRPPSGWGR
jgi:hypothetical protein